MRRAEARRGRAAWLPAAFVTAVAMSGCGSVGVGLAANNQGGAVGLSTGIGLPTVNAPRATWQALPPPRLVDPAAADAGADARKVSP